MSTNSLSLKSFRKDGIKHGAVYVGRHSTAGRSGTTLEFDVVVVRMGDRGPWSASIDFGLCEGVSPAQAMSRLADWCARAAETLQRSNSWTSEGENLPVGDV